MLRSISSVKMRGGVLVVVMTAASVFMSEAAVAAPKASKQERQERQTRYRDLDRKEAKELAEREFPKKFKERQWHNVLERADRVREYVGDAAAVVELPGRERPALVQSTLPLRARDESGAMSDLDTGLVARAGALRARNALVDARFGQSAVQGVQLEGGIGVRFTGVAGEAQAQIDGDKAFYAATMPATDQTLVATPNGLEVLWQLRGRDAPEQFGLDFALPPGAKLRLVREADRPVRVEVFKDKEVLLEIRAPAAWDAELQPIPVEYEVAGRRLTVRVSHRDRDALYPIVVDPTFVLENWIHRNGDYSVNWQTDPNLDFLGWAPATLDGAPEFQQGYGGGLMVAFNPGETGDGEWRWRPPGNARVFRAEYAAYSYWGPYVDCVQEGIKSSNGGWADTLNGAPDQPLQPSAHPCDGPGGYQIYCLRAQPCGSAGGAPGDFAVFGASRSEYSEYRAETNLPGAAVFVADHDRPYFTQADVWENLLDDRNWSFEQDQAYWTPLWADGGSYTLAPRVHGERHYSIRRRAGEGIDGYALASSGAVPAEAGRSYRASFSARPEAGVRPALARAELFFLDASGQELARQYGPWARETSAPDWRRVPEVSAQAPAGTASVTMRMAWSETLDGQWHNADAAMLEAVCSEGCANRWTNSARRYVNTVATDDGLGAKRIRLSHATRAGGTSTDSRTHPCAGNRFDYCPAPYNRDGVGFNQAFQIDTDDLPEGIVDLDATSTDVTDNDSLKAVLPPANIDRTAPSLTLTGSTRERQVSPNVFQVDDGEHDLKIVTTDTVSATPTSGVRSIDVFLDNRQVLAENQPCEQSCGMERTYYFNTNDPAHTEGDHAVRVVVRDGAGNERTESFTLRVAYYESDRPSYVPEDQNAQQSYGDGGYDSGCAEDESETYCGEQDMDVDAGGVPSGARVAVGPAPGAASAFRAVTRGVTIGLVNENDVGAVNPWEDARLTNATSGLGIDEGRLIVPWNVYSRAKASNPSDPASTATNVGRDLDRFRRALLAMKRGGFERPLLSFERQRDHKVQGNIPDQPLPTTNAYMTAVTGLLDHIDAAEASQTGDQYPELRRFTSWNEVNLAPRQPTGGVANARAAGRFHRVLAKYCKAGKCTVAAGSFLQGVPGFASYFREYCDGMDGKPDGNCGYRPIAWAFHPYGCAYRRDTGSLLNFVKATRANSNGTPSAADPPIWFTEAGGNLTFHYNGDSDGQTASRDELSRRANADLAFLLDTCITASARISRFWIYNWSGDQRLKSKSGGGLQDEGFDAGLTDFAQDATSGAPSPTNRFKTRTMYCTVLVRVRPGGSCSPETP